MLTLHYHRRNNERSDVATRCARHRVSQRWRADSDCKLAAKRYDSLYKPLLGKALPLPEQSCSPQSLLQSVRVRPNRAEGFRQAGLKNGADKVHAFVWICSLHRRVTKPQLSQASDAVVYLNTARSHHLLIRAIH